MAVPKRIYEPSNVWPPDECVDSLIKPDEIKSLIKAYSDPSAEVRRDVFEREYMADFRVRDALPSAAGAFKGAADAFITAGDALKRSFGGITTGSFTAGTGKTYTGDDPGPITMKEVEAAMDRLRKRHERDRDRELTLRKSIMAISEKIEDTSDPTGWKMTSVRWITENHPEYMVRRGVAAHDKLRGALASMGYCEAEASTSDGAMRKDVAIGMRGDLLKKWDQAEHDAMVAYLAKGGLSARIKELRPEVTLDALLDRASKSKPAWPMAMEATKPYIEQDLDQVVEELSNPTNGSW